MYLAKIAPAGLGALPALLVTAVLTMVDHNMSKDQIQRQLATQYEQMQRLSEAQLTETAVLLGRRTATPEWEWFNLLRSARDMALFTNGDPGNGTPPPPPPPSSLTTWIGLGAVALVLLIVLRR